MEDFGAPRDCLRGLRSACGYSPENFRCHQPLRAGADASSGLDCGGGLVGSTTAGAGVGAAGSRGASAWTSRLSLALQGRSGLESAAAASWRGSA
jgi:hypothetical protein